VESDELDDHVHLMTQTIMMILAILTVSKDYVNDKTVVYSTILSLGAASVGHQQLCE
jgi:hypothetical protein